MASEQQLQSIKSSKVLIVGAGGIRCELPNILSLSGFQDIHIIEMDTIEVSNLNRQFLFRKSHVGQSKAKVARDAVLRFRPQINITPYHANGKDPDFNVDFFKQFNVVLNGLDNLDARRHVNRLCLADDVPLVESGTTGFLGQSKTECYECQPKPTPKSYHVCTITSTPSKELIFAKLFGDKNQDNDLNVQDVFERMEGEDPEQYGKRIYDHVFGYNIEVALSNEETWKNRNRPRPIYSKDVFPNGFNQSNGNADKVSVTVDPSSVSAMASLSLKNPHDIWSLSENSKILLEALKLFLGKRDKEIGNLIFDKDDQLAVEFVTAAANIRASSFGIPLHSLFEAKGIAGNIVHAVATTNAIIAGLIVIEAIKVLQSNSNNCRMTYFLENPSRKILLMPVEPFEPNKSCYVCSEVNTNSSKLRDFVEKIVKNKLGMCLPLIMHWSALLYEVGDDLDQAMVANYTSNLDKVLAELPFPVTSGTVLTVEDLQHEFTCNINIKHKDEFDDEKEPDGMVLSGCTQAPSKEKDDNMAVSNGASTSSASQSTVLEAEDDDDVEIVPIELAFISAGAKRKLSEISNSNSSAHLSVGDGYCGEKKIEVVDEEDVVVMLKLAKMDACDRLATHVIFHKP
ncbi:hypothetical protein MKX03_036899 [Papaver bracteatum]|nr:hypothetical protein MKX03_036899 [Papaver bracteatum]